MHMEHTNAGNRRFNIDKKRNSEPTVIKTKIDPNAGQKMTPSQVRKQTKNKIAETIAVHLSMSSDNNQVKKLSSGILAPNKKTIVNASKTPQNKNIQKQTAKAKLPLRIDNSSQKK